MVGGEGGGGRVEGRQRGVFSYGIGVNIYSRIYTHKTNE